MTLKTAVADPERMVLSCLLMHNEVIPDVRDVIHVDDFATDRNRVIYSAIMQLHAEKKIADLITVSTVARGVDAVYLAELTSELSVPENIHLWSNRVIGQSQRREIARTIERVKEGLEGKTTRDLIEDLSSAVSVVENRKITRAAVWTDGMLHKAMQQVEAEQMGETFGIYTGFADLDAMTQGFKAGELIIVGARTSVGKSAFALQVAIDLAMNDVPVGFITTEMTAVALLKRAMFAEAEVNLYEPGWYQTGGADRLVAAASRMTGKPLFGCDKPGLELSEMSAVIRQMVRRHDCSVVFVDYLTMVTVEGDYNRYEAIGRVTEKLANLAKELMIPIVAMAQLSRKAEERKRPTLSDLRESGNIEQDADVVILLHRAKDNDGLMKAETDAIVAKNRNGQTGIARLMFVPEHTRFEAVREW